MTKEERIRRAQEAKSLEENEFIRLAWRQIEAQILKELLECEWDDDKRRLAAQIALQFHERYQAIFFSAIRDGKIAAKEITYFEEQTKRPERVA